MFEIWEKFMPAPLRDMLITGRHCLIDKTVVPGSYPGLLVYVAAVTQVTWPFLM